MRASTVRANEKLDVAGELPRRILDPFAGRIGETSRPDIDLLAEDSSIGGCKNRKNLLFLRNRRLKGERERGREEREREIVRFSE